MSHAVHDILPHRLNISDILDTLNNTLRDKPVQVKLALASLLTGGHILIEDVPGTGKTSLARAFAHHLGLASARLQCTNDTLPSDIIGVNIFDSDGAQFTLRKGVVFTQLLLADELNRAPSKSQSALLEAMAEKQVSIDGVVYCLPEPFIVIATQNPQEQIGVSPLPESQLDRFAMSFSLGRPAPAIEADILRTSHAVQPLPPPLLMAGQFQELMQMAINIHVSDRIIDYIQTLAMKCRTTFLPTLSVRALMHTKGLAQAYALIEQRDYVIPEDVQEILIGTWCHRASSENMMLNNTQTHDALIDVIESVKVP